MLKVPGATPGAAFGEAHELAPPFCSFPVCVWTNGPVLAIVKPVIVEKFAPAAGAAAISARAVTARAMRALTTPLRLQRELARRPNRQPAHVGAVHDLSCRELLALGELLAHRLREREADLRGPTRGHGERLRPDRLLPELDRVGPGAADDGRRGAGEAQRQSALLPDDLRDRLERDPRVRRRPGRRRTRRR